MQLFAVITSDKSGMIPDFGTVRAGKPLVIDEFKMVRIEAKRREKFCNIPLPVGFEMTLHVLEDDQELELEGSEQ